MKAILQQTYKNIGPIKSIIKLQSKVKVHYLTDQQIHNLNKIQNCQKTRWTRMFDSKGNLNIIKQFVFFLNKKVYNVIDVYRLDLDLFQKKEKENNTVFEDLIMEAKGRLCKPADHQIQTNHWPTTKQKVVEIGDKSGLANAACLVRRQKSTDIKNNGSCRIQCYNMRQNQNMENIIEYFKKLT